MHRAEFEKIVGDDCVTWEMFDLVTVFSDNGQSIEFNLAITTPLQVRFGCHAIGVKCDWDEPVSFERLMELEGSVDISFESMNHAVEFNLKTHRFDFRKWDDGWLCNDKMPTKTMRQVHLLLEAAGVGK